MDVKTELDRMRAYEDTQWAKFDEGRHSVVFVGEPEETTYTNPEGKEQDQIVFDVQYKQEAKKWSIPKGVGTGSIQYQLFRCAESNFGKFNGLMVSFMVTGKDKHKRYSVFEFKLNDNPEPKPYVPREDERNDC